MNICPKVDVKTNEDEQSKILCNVIVRATHELHVHQQKDKDEIQSFLKTDCQKLETSQLAKKVRKSEKIKSILSFYLVRRFSRTTWN